MGSQPETTNEPATIINTTLSGAGKIVVGVVENMIVADVPWLGLPGIKQIWEGLLSWICGYVEKATQEGATFAVIDVQVSSEQSALSKALANLVAAQKSGDKDAIRSAILVYQQANSALIHDDGSAHPQ